MFGVWHTVGFVPRCVVLNVKVFGKPSFYVVGIFVGPSSDLDAGLPTHFAAVHHLQSPVRKKSQRHCLDDVAVFHHVL